MGLDLRDKQIANIKQMLNLNEPVTKSTSAEPAWKILVYDRDGQDILSPLLTVQELRHSGVTLHVMLHSERENIPDVPAVYFCVPTDNNVERICRDIQSGLYDLYYLNFVAPIPRPKIESLAEAAWQSHSGSKIKKVFDQYLNFITLESDMFVLKHQDASQISFYALNRGDVQDTEMEQMLDTIVDSLFSVFSSIGVVPIIRSPKGNAAEHIAEKLDKKIRDNLRDPRSSLFSSDPLSWSQYTHQRPVLVIFDRGMDLATPLSHTWTYQALAHDVLDLSLNQIKFVENEDSEEPGPSRKVPKNKNYDLDDRRDQFWNQHKGSPFPTVAEAIQTELEDYRKSEDEIKRLKTTMGLDGNLDLSEVGSDLLNDNTAKLTSAISNLPQLLERKRILDAHTSIATAILKQIKERKLDRFFELESKIVGRSALDRGILDTLLDREMGLPEDKLRFFLIYYLLLEQAMPQSELDQFTSALESAGCNLAPLYFVKKWISYTKMASVAVSASSTSSSRTTNMLRNLQNTWVPSLMEGVRNLVIKRQNLPLTRIVEEIMDGKVSQETEDFRYFDPKLLKPSNVAPKGVTYQDAIVFVVGGGNYIEYQNLVDCCKAKTSAGTTKRVIYGCSTLTNASQFLKQLSHLGEEQR